MAKIGLVDCDSHNFPNLPLMKLSAYHKSLGDKVVWYEPMFTGHCDKVYMSKVFSFTPDYEYIIDADEVSRGGTGYCITLENGKEVFHKENNVWLPDEVEHQYPDYSLYYNKYDEVKNTAYGFLTRGCPRGCSFCIVTPKEGRCSHKVADLEEFWNGQPNINLSDPNMFACKDWESLAEQLIKSNANVNFNQGCDIRLMTEDKIEAIKQMKIKNIDFAWDNYEDKEMIVPKFELFKKMAGYDRRKMLVYTLTNYNTTFEQDLERVMILRELGFYPYITIYNKKGLPKYSKTKRLQRWVNNRFLWEVCPTFDEFMKTYKEE